MQFIKQTAQLITTNKYNVLVASNDYYVFVYLLCIYLSKSSESVIIIFLYSYVLL